MRKSLFEKIIQSYNDEDVIFTDEEIRHKERLEKILEIRLKEVSLPDVELYKRVKHHYPQITFYNFCKDINYVERILANQIDPTGDPRKVFIRYFIGEVTKQAIEIAKEKKDAYTMAYASNIMGKHNQTDKEDIIRPPFDKIIPQTFEITSDPSVLGIKPIDDLDKRKKELADKYGIVIEKLEFIKETKITKSIKDGSKE